MLFGSNGVKWHYSRKAARKDGAQLIRYIMSSSSLLRSWGENGIAHTSIPYCRDFHDCSPKGIYGDIEVIVTSHDAVPEDAIEDFDITISKCAYYFGIGMTIWDPWNTFLEKRQ